MPSLLDITTTLTPPFPISDQRNTVLPHTTSQQTLSSSFTLLSRSTSVPEALMGHAAGHGRFGGHAAEQGSLGGRAGARGRGLQVPMEGVIQGMEARHEAEVMRSLRAAEAVERAGLRL
eukprot:CAMPEP_0184715086 /NCGR_PEP_ID=MMETSP0314-20130426/5083_1 /TAXON_ID=38298 /ORGANISM="Rhodella maculata, Strain CCMP 736" /LENGTH=118 /DNA_ID=CAMNT_0027178141 /DNA_START=355 /DNA_END=711 /DNA_ORIENTATION=+